MFDFSKRLLKLRKSRGLSQIELAQKVQISRAHCKMKMSI